MKPANQKFHAEIEKPVRDFEPQSLSAIAPGSTGLHAAIGQFVEKLAAEVETAKTSEPLLRYLAAAARFHDYSLHNTILIFMQKPDATRVAGFHAWRKLGRWVRKGEKGIAILAPILVKANREDQRQAIAAEEEPQVVTRFRTVYVFDVSQTDGADLPEPPVLTGAECSDEFSSALTMFANAQGIIVRSEKLSGSAMGLSRGGTIILDESLDGADRFAVLVHETAHELLNHRARREELDKKAREIEAESVAFTVCQHFGVPCTAPAYLALHRADAKEITEHLSAIVGVVQDIIRGIEGNMKPAGNSVTEGESREAANS